MPTLDETADQPVVAPSARPRVSIAMATFNGERYLTEQLESFAAQTLAPAELVVTDDASTDGTLDVLSAFAARAPFPVRIFVNERRLGHNDNFFRAASLCEGEIIAFSDQDDVWAPDKLSVCVEVLERDDALLVHHRATLVDGELRDIGMLDQFIACDRTIERLGVQPLTGMAFGFTLVVRRALVTLVDPAVRPQESEWPDKPIAYDAWLFLLASLFGKISQIHRPLAKYRQHGANVSGHQVQGLGERLRAFVDVPLDRYRNRLAFTDDVARMLVEVAPVLAPAEAEMAREGAAFYRKISGHMSRRIRLFEARSLPTRLATFAGLVTTQAYAPRDQAGLGRPSAVRDFLAGVMKLGRIRTALTTA